MNNKDDNSFKIRPGIIDDAHSIAQILRNQRIFNHIDSETIDETAHRITSRFEASIPTHDTVLIAEMNGAILGYGAVRWMQNLILKGVDGYLSELFIDPKATGLGIGSNLLNAFRAEAKQRNADRLWCINLRDRESYNRGFYIKSGWNERDIAVFMEKQ